MENEDREKRKIEETDVKIEQNDNKKQKVPITAPEITGENKDEIAKKVLKQIHFYFSDSNMNDKFLRKKISEDKEGYVDISLLTSFNRMKTICVDIPFIAKLIGEKSTKVLVDGTRVKRSTPWPTEDNSSKKTIFAKNIPPQWMLEEIETFFEKYGTVNRVFMIRNKGNFDGSVLIEFDTEEETKKALEAKPMVDGKIVEIEPKKEDKEKNDKKERKGRDGDKKQETPQIDFFLKFTELDKESNFNVIKDLFKIHGNPWVIYESKSDHGFLKFRTAEEANEYLKKITEAKQLFNGKELTYSLFEGKQDDIIKKNDDIFVIKFSGVQNETNFNTIKDLLKLHGNPWVIYENKSDHGFLKFRSAEEGNEYLKKITEAKQLFDGKEYVYEILSNEESSKFKNEKGKGRGKGKGKFKGKGKGNRRKRN